jgi:hypothetical protein
VTANTDDERVPITELRESLRKTLPLGAVVVGPRWVPVTESPLPLDFTTFLWGTKLEPGKDLPVSGRRCGCHELYVVEDYAIGYESEEAREADSEACVERLLGEVTHWLDWRPGPESLVVAGTIEEKVETEWLGCHASKDGDCSWEHCPQIQDGEPGRSGRHCPLDTEGLVEW